MDITRDLIFWSDLARYYFVIVALWLVLMILRLTYIRLHRYGISGLWLRAQPHPHPLLALGLALNIGLSAERRFRRLGLPGDHFLVISVIAITLILIGVMMNVSINFAPPWRRRNADD